MKMDENLNLDSDGRPFKMLVFRGSPKSSRKSIRHIDEMRRSEDEALYYAKKATQYRYFPKVDGPFTYFHILKMPAILSFFSNRIHS